eukprot:2205257-Ditylum_brightwellii.AAC.1
MPPFLDSDYDTDSDMPSLADYHYEMDGEEESDSKMSSLADCCYEANDEEESGCHREKKIEK